MALMDILIFLQQKEERDIVPAKHGPESEAFSFALMLEEEAYNKIAVKAVADPLYMLAAYQKGEDGKLILKGSQPVLKYKGLLEKVLKPLTNKSP
jgi:hypothetical protein